MHRPSAPEFLLAVLEDVSDLPSDFATRLGEVLEKVGVDRSQALRKLFEDVAEDVAGE